jgi:hypothetical protein
LWDWFHGAKLQEHPSTRGFFGITLLEELEKSEKDGLADAQYKGPVEFMVDMLNK